MSATLLYVRHGENKANLTRQLSHRVVDHPLTERGRIQARRVAGYFAAGGGGVIAAVYTSPLRRARETASIIADGLGLPVAVHEDLREVDVGDLDGRSDDEAWRIYEAVERAWWDGQRDAVFPGGENLTMLLERLRAALRSIAVQVSTGRAVVVGHGAIIRTGVINLFPGPTTSSINDHMPNCSITELEVTPERHGIAGKVIAWGSGPP